MIDSTSQPFPPTDRRDFLRISALAALGALPATGAFAQATDDDGPLTNKPIDEVRVGLVGAGGMGRVHVANLARIPGCRLTAICDIREEHTARAQQMVVDAGHARPTGYSRGETDYERMIETEDLDLVYNATPWRWHVPIATCAMRNGKHVAVEVPASYTLDGCWELVETAEKHRRHCMMLENCCYDRVEMLALQLVRAGLLGEVLHGEAGYMHDLRAIKWSKTGEGLWRRAHSQTRNGNLYPTHGLGPVAQCMDINRGDQFDYVVSMSGPSRGLQDYARRHLPDDDPRRSETFKLGDVNVSLIRTKRGRTIYLGHDTNLPRPYSRLYLVQGTRGIIEGYPPRVHIEGRSEGHGWEKLDDYYRAYEHPLWKQDAARQASAGHGGMDYLESARLIECLRTGTPLDMDVYDAAAISAMCELTERSVANRSQAIDVPDFTRGRWKTRRPPAAVKG